MESENIIRDKLNKFSDKLIDLSKRNKMINSNFQSRSKTHFRIIDEVPDKLYKILLESDMEFISLPSLNSEPKDEDTPKFKKEIFLARDTDEEYIKSIKQIEENQEDNLNELYEKAERQLKDRLRAKLGMPPRSTKDTPIKEHCKNQGLNPDFDLPRPDKNSKDNPNWNDKKIQTLMLPDHLNKYMDSIYKKYNSFIKETGVNFLFFCFGFLEWTEAESSNFKLYSPILTFQAVLNRKKRKLFVKGSENELNINQALNYKLKKDFFIELPEFRPTENNQTENNQIDIYLNKVEKEIARERSWKIKNWVSFGLYSTQNMVIGKDIKDISKTKIKGGRLEKILLGKSSDRNNPEEYNIDDKKYQKQIPALIDSADASQHQAILDVLEGKDLVIKGPPGTGKSQTIVNIISSLISKRKKVLFVAQKQAALEVVKNKLQAKGLDDYILEIFSIKANKKHVIESIRRRLNMDPPSINTCAFMAKSNAFYETKEKLNSYSNLMSKKFKQTNFNIHDIIWRYKPTEELQFFNIKNIESISKEIINKHIKLLKKIKKIYKENNLKSLKCNPFCKIKKLPLSYDRLCNFNNKIDNFYEEVKTIIKEENEILKLNKSLTDLNKSVFENPLIKEWFKLDESEKKDYLKILKIVFLTESEKLRQFFNKRSEYKKTLEKTKLYKKYFKLDNPSSDLILIREVIEILERKNIFSYNYWINFWKGKKIVKEVYTGKEQYKLFSLLNSYYIALETYPKNKEKELENNINQFL